MDKETGEIDDGTRRCTLRYPAGAATGYTQAMKQDNPPTHDQKMEARRQDRMAREADDLSEARAELDAGLYVDAGDIDAWIDSIGTHHELPPPPTRRR